MATPTYGELLGGSTQWVKSHNGVSYMLSHHAFRRGDEYPGARPQPGIWCYYIRIPEQMYPHRWADFACSRSEHGFEHPGVAFDHDLFASEITWSSSEPYFCRKEMKMFDASKVGCDYGHLWNEEHGYPDTLASVTHDAIMTVEKLIAAHPDRRLRSGYSGKWDAPDKFYTAVNGSLVHEDDEISPDWKGWQLQAAEEQS